MMFDSLKNALKRNRLFSFNLINRDAWIAHQAALLPQGTRILDVGAGSCPYRNAFSHCIYKTQDFAGLRDDQIRSGTYGRIDYISDAASIPVEDKSFDAILCSEVLEHVPEPIKVIAEFARILAPGGKLILTAPLGSGVHQEPFHYYGGYTFYWYEKFLSEAGFENIEISPNNGSFSHYAQESIRFMRDTRPGRLRLPFPSQILWGLCWVMLFPFLGVLVPLVCGYLDRFDSEKRFTVGYHVTAIRSHQNLFTPGMAENRPFS